MSPIFQCFYIGCIGEKLRGTEMNQFHAADSVYQEAIQRKK